jgi:uncharacterized membrane protein
MNPRKAVCILAAFLFTFVPLTPAQGTYTQIDVPGASFTACGGVNAAGDIVGAYKDASSQYHGFLLSGGTYTTVDYPGTLGTQLNGINDKGQIVGVTSSSRFVGFLYDLATQTFTTISYPRATATTPFSINNAGIIAGYYTYGNRGQSGGFEWAGTAYRSIKPPGAANSIVHGISSAAEVVGNVSSTQGTANNFLFNHGKYNPILIPNAPGAVIYGVNPAGTALVGIYRPTGVDLSGFLYQSKTTQTLQFPGAADTGAIGINAVGEIVGFFYDSSFNVHCFAWTPPGDAARK